MWLGLGLGIGASGIVPDATSTRYTAFTSVGAGTPAGWTAHLRQTDSVAVVTGVPGARHGTALQVTLGSGDAARWLAWDDVVTSPAYEIRMRFLRTDPLLPSAGFANPEVWSAIGAAPVAANDEPNKQALSVSSQWLGSVLGTYVRWYRIFTGTYSDENVAADPSLYDDATQVWINVVMRADGTAGRIKVWTGLPSDEPETWSYTGTRTSEGGGVGIGAFFAGRPYLVDQFSVGLDGNPAPVLLNP